MIKRLIAVCVSVLPLLNFVRNVLICKALYNGKSRSKLILQGYLLNIIPCTYVCVESLSAIVYWPNGKQIVDLVYAEM